MDVAATRAFLDSCLASYRDPGFSQWAVIERAAGRLVGFCGINPVRVGGRDEVELGYRLASDRWGRGLATEAGAVVLESAFGHWRLDSVVAIIAERHQVSRRVAGKLGLAFDYATRYRGWDVAVYRRTHTHMPHAGAHEPR